MRSLTLHPSSIGLRYLIAAAAITGAVSFGLLSGKAAAACQAPATDYGTASLTLNAPAAGSYRIWSRIKTVTSTSNSYMLEVDGTCYTVGGTGLSSTDWQWIDYQGGNTASKVQQTLAQGTHTLRLIGLQPGILVDRVIATSDLTCTPVAASGDECNRPDDTAAPTVNITAPADNATVSASTTVTATATDNVGVAKVVFLLNNAVVSTDTSSPYSYQLDTTPFANGTYTLAARAYDAAGNSSGDQRTITIQNGDTQAPSTPANVKATPVSNSQIDLSWSASTDNIGVSGYVIMRNGSPLITVGTVTNYSDNNLTANTAYSYQILAKDAAGNTSPASPAVQATTTNPADTQAPSVPANLTATAVSESQINLSWTASTDNIGVSGYEIYRQTGISPAQKIATVTQTTFGDTTLIANTSYTYTVKARDAAGNTSAPSSGATATTQAAINNSELVGVVRNARRHPIAGAKVSLMIDGTLRTFTTTSKGTYDIFPISGGNYSITYSATGYRTTVINRKIDPGTRVNQNVTLVKQ